MAAPGSREKKQFLETLQGRISVFDQGHGSISGNYSIPYKIVSIFKLYIGRIIRDKEVKEVEFGAKPNMIQVDGINFIEHLSFDAFNEGTRLIESVRYSRSLFGKITHVSTDDIYATNANSKWCSGQKIVTNFKRKGRAGKY